MDQQEVAKLRLKLQLLDNPLFSGFSHELLDRLLSESLCTTYKAGETVFGERDWSERMFFVSSGTLKLYRLSTQGCEKVLDLACVGDLVALASLFLKGQLYGYWCQALVDSVLIEIPRKEVVKLLNSEPEMSAKIIGELSCQVLEKIEQIDSICLKSAANRFAEYLLQMSDQCDGNAEVSLPADKHVIASKLSIAPETFSRLIGSFKKENVIDAVGTKMVIRDMAYLRNITGKKKTIKYY
ncbi:MAG: Crp/Fnr family transcriptional regulator [Sedimenticola sp.]